MKLVHSFQGIYLTLLNVKKFDPTEMFKGKEVAIVGPADSAYEVKNGDFIDSFDYVIRVNKAIHSWDKEKAEFVGKKTDILFHSFFENNESGGGPLDLELFKRAGLKFLINPRTNFSSYRRTFNFFRKYRQKGKVYHLPNSFYKKMSEPFGEYRPTIGYTALYSALFGQCHKVFITGFTFFKTPYTAGYRDHLQDLHKNLDHINTHDVHDVDLEFDLFIQNLRKANSSNLIFDDKLQKIIAAATHG